MPLYKSAIMEVEGRNGTASHPIPKDLLVDCLPGTFMAIASPQERGSGYYGARISSDRVLISYDSKSRMMFTVFVAGIPKE